MKKVKTSFTLSADASELLAILAAKFGVSKTDVVEIAVRQLAQREQIKVQDAK